MIQINRFILCESIIRSMQGFRSVHSLRLWVLAWFVLALGAAVASPLVQPRTLELICAGAGGPAKLVAHATDGLAAPADAAGGMQCPACLPVDTPPSAAPAAAPALAIPAPPPDPRRTSVALLTVPLGPPARAPPVFQPRVS